MIVLFNKPYGVLTRFTPEPGSRWTQTLADFIELPDVYPCGRLDADSEGLLVLTDDGRLQAKIARTMAKTYQVQVEGTATEAHCAQLTRGVMLRDGPARALAARLLPAHTEPWPRQPPIRVRRQIPTSWLELVLDQGRNRQVRRMTAAVGLPTLRLIRVAVGPWALDGLAPGQWRVWPERVPTNRA
ncbi:MAG: pseudouridine synthase [Casimicrobiaceae bacterium]